MSRDVGGYYCPSCEKEAMGPTNADGNLYRPNEHWRESCKAPFCYCIGVGMEMIPCPAEDYHEGVYNAVGDRSDDQGEEDRESDP